MTVTFNPKAKGISSNLPSEQSEREGEAPPPLAEEGALPAPIIDPPAAVSEMELLFSGVRRLNTLRTEHPLEPIEVPDLQKDLLERIPTLSNSSYNITAITDNYLMLRKNLLERRNNYSHAIESYVRPEEALDLFERIEEIDRALSAIQKNLDRLKQVSNIVNARENASAEEIQVIRHEHSFDDNGHSSDPNMNANVTDYTEYEQNGRRWGRLVQS